MSAEALTSNALLDILGRALSPITSALETVRTRPSPTLWHDAVAEQKSFAVSTYKKAAAWEYKNPLKSTISIRRLSILFDDKPDETYKPLVEIYVDEGRVFHSVGNAFENTDLSLELDGGRTLPRDRAVRVFIWNASTDVSAKKATFALEAGEP